MLSEVGSNSVDEPRDLEPNLQDDSNDLPFESDFVRTRGKDSAGYPDTGYRAMPNMLDPNQEPMSISVYDKIRNGIMPNDVRGESSNRIARFHRAGSHYTAPGSRPFNMPSGKMINGEYVGMSSNLLRRQFFSHPDE